MLAGPVIGFVAWLTPLVRLPVAECAEGMACDSVSLPGGSVGGWRVCSLRRARGVTLPFQSKTREVVGE